MAEAVIFSSDGTKVGEYSLPSDIFDYEVKEHLMYEAVKNFLANNRQGTASTKSRNEVSGGGRKPWRQKGTGRARAGSIRSPLWVGGGVAHGPKPRDYYYKLPKKMRRGALKSALTLKARDNKIIVLDSIDLPEVKTKHFYKILETLNVADKKVMFVLPEYDEDIFRACRNIPTVWPVIAHEINTYEVLYNEYILATKEALNRIVEVWSSEGSETDN